MKKSIIFSLILLMTAFFTSCNNRKSYSEQLNEQEALIKAYIQRNNIKVIVADSVNSNHVWQPNDYFKLPSGLYFHLENPGDKNVTAKSKSIIIINHTDYTLSQNPDTVIRALYPLDPDYTSMTLKYEYGTYNVLSDNKISVRAIHEAITYMKNNDSSAKIIVPANLNIKPYSDNVTPMGYDLTIRVQP